MLKSGNLGNVLLYNKSKSIFSWKTLFLSPIFQATSRVSIEEFEDFKICDISKLTLGPYFEIFWLWTPHNSKLSFPTTGTFRDGWWVTNVIHFGTYLGNSIFVTVWSVSHWILTSCDNFPVLWYINICETVLMFLVLCCVHHDENDEIMITQKGSWIWDQLWSS